jgi:hypothetical protein
MREIENAERFFAEADQLVAYVASSRRLPCSTTRRL